jgi:hypothetical protein
MATRLTEQRAIVVKTTRFFILSAPRKACTSYAPASRLPSLAPESASQGVRSRFWAVRETNLHKNAEKPAATKPVQAHASIGKSGDLYASTKGSKKDLPDAQNIRQARFQFRALRAAEASSS